MASADVYVCNLCGREGSPVEHPFPACGHCDGRMVRVIPLRAHRQADDQPQALAPEDMPWLVLIQDVTEELDATVSLPPAVALAEILKLTEQALADHTAGRASYLALCSALEKVRRFASLQ